MSKTQSALESPCPIFETPKLESRQGEGGEASGWREGGGERVEVRRGGAGVVKGWRVEGGGWRVGGVQVEGCGGVEV